MFKRHLDCLLHDAGYQVIITRLIRTIYFCPLGRSRNNLSHHATCNEYLLRLHLAFDISSKRQGYGHHLSEKQFSFVIRLKGISTFMTKLMLN